MNAIHGTWMARYQGACVATRRTGKGQRGYGGVIGALATTLALLQLITSVVPLLLGVSDDSGWIKTKEVSTGSSGWLPPE